MEALIRVLFDQPLLKEQIAIALHSFRQNKTVNYIALRSHNFVKITKLEEIIYLQADDNYITFFLQDGEKVVTTRPLKEYEELLAGTFFLRTHQSYLINESYIDRYYPKEGTIYLTDGTKIPVSLRKKELIDLHFKKM
jgi:two-component system LytT family response regulator